MPIGRSDGLDLMLTPEQRVRLWRRTWELVRERRLLIADFWNSATTTNGCIAGGRSGGYLYVKLERGRQPVRVHTLRSVNIHDVYALGGTLDDVWPEPFFARIRAWQRERGYRESGEPCGRWGNWLAPCLIRDHHATFLRILRRYRPRPTDDEAEAALLDPRYHDGLEGFGAALAALTDPVWESQYRALRAQNGGPTRDPCGSPRRP